MVDAVVFLFKTILSIFSLAFIIRFYLQVVRASPGNPLSNFVGAITDWAVIPTRRMVPGYRGYDLSTLVLAILAESLLLTMMLAVTGFDIYGTSFVAIFAIFSLSLITVARMIVYIVIVVTFVQAILSWVNPYSPIMSLLFSMSAPFLRIFQRRIPSLGGVDVSPLILLVICQLILIWPINSLYMLVMNYLVRM